VIEETAKIDAPVRTKEKEGHHHIVALKKEASDLEEVKPRDERRKINDHLQGFIRLMTATYPLNFPV
jgi:hypothetical protein